MADQEPKGTLTLILMDAAGQDLNAEISLQIICHGLVICDYHLQVRREVRILGVPHADVMIRVQPAGFQEQVKEVRVGPGRSRVTISFPVDDKKVVDIAAPEFGDLDHRLQNVLHESRIPLEVRREAYSGAALYRALRAPFKASLLNTFSKAAGILLPIGGTVWDQVSRLLQITPQAILFDSTPSLIQAARQSALPAAIATAAKPGPAVISAGGFRTTEESGSLNVEVYQGHEGAVIGRASVLGEQNHAPSPWHVREILAAQPGVTPPYRPVLPGELTGAKRQPPRRITLGVTHPGLQYAMHQRRMETGRDVSTRLIQVDEGEPPVTSDGMKVNQGIIDDAGETHRVEDALRPGQTCLYWLEINREARKGGDSESFTEPDELKAGPVVVQVQVRCDLLGGKGFAAKKVTYQPGVGLARQSFALTTQPGSYALTVQVVYQSRPVYSRRWTLKVEEFSADEREQAAIALESEEEPITVPEHGTYRLLADGVYVRRLALEVPGQSFFTGADPPDPGLLIERAAAARASLNKFSRTAAPQPDLTLDWAATVWPFLREMAIWGAETAESIFGKRVKFSEFYQALDSVPPGSYVHIDSEPGSFPWDWLYLQEVPDAEAPPLGSAELSRVISGFWGCRFRGDLLAPADLQRLKLTEVLANSAETRILSAVNSTADSSAAPQNLTFMQSVGSWRGVGSNVCEGRDKTVEALKKAAIDGAHPLHLLYIYCHHAPGAQLNEMGFHNFGDSTLYLKGKNEEPISRRYMQYDSGIKSFAGSAPLVLLNACGTALGNDYYPSGFMPYFTNKLNTPAVIGTIAEVPTLAGHQFAQAFLPRWLATGSVLDTIAEIRRDWLLHKGNPYAMYYTVYGNGTVRLAQVHEESPS